MEEPDLDHSVPVVTVERESETEDGKYNLYNLILSTYVIYLMKKENQYSLTAMSTSC
jgi:hypothetical protein